MSLIETVEDAERYAPADPDNLGYVTQTTLSVDDTAGVIAAARAVPQSDGSRRRQHLLCHHQPPGSGASMASPGCDLFLIVGAPNSSNSKRLVEVALKSGARKNAAVQRAVGHRLGAIWAPSPYRRPLGRRIGAGSHRQ